MSAGNAGGIKWCLDNDVWEQVGERFVLEQLAGNSVPPAITDLDYLAGARREAGGSAFVPRQFRYSPLNGNPLANLTTSAWLPPASSSQGNRLCDGDGGEALGQLLPALITQWQTPGRNMQASATTVDAPSSSGLLFFACDAGGYRDALFALVRSGALWLRQRSSNTWVALRARKQQLGRHSFEHWSAAVVTLPGTHGSDIVLASDEGADLLQIDPVNLQYTLDRSPGAAFGAPGRLGAAALVPQRGRKGCQVAVRDDGRWSSIRISGDMPEAMQLGAPVTTPNGHGLMWIGEQGWLLVREQGDAFEARWEAWPAGMIARPRLGPPYRNGQGDWQLLQNQDDKSTCAYLLGATLRTEEPLKRLSVTTGAATFQLNVRVTRPWDDYDPDDHPDGLEHIIHPFLEAPRLGQPGSALLFLRAANADRAPLVSFYESRQRHLVHYAAGWPLSPNQTYTTESAEPWNAQWFVHDDALWLWVDDRGLLLRWSKA